MGRRLPDGRDAKRDSAFHVELAVKFAKSHSPQLNRMSAGVKLVLQRAFHLKSLRLGIDHYGTFVPQLGRYVDHEAADGIGFLYEQQQEQEEGRHADGNRTEGQYREERIPPLAAA